MKLLIAIILISSFANASEIKVTEKPYWSDVEFITAAIRLDHKQKDHPNSIYDYEQAVPGLKYLKKLNKTS